MQKYQTLKRDLSTEKKYELAREHAKQFPEMAGIRIFADEHGWYWGFTALGSSCVAVGDEEGPFESRRAAVENMLAYFDDQIPARSRA